LNVYIAPIQGITSAGLYNVRYRYEQIFLVSSQDYAHCTVSWKRWLLAVK